MAKLSKKSIRLMLIIGGVVAGAITVAGVTWGVVSSNKPKQNEESFEIKKEPQKPEKKLSKKEPQKPNNKEAKKQEEESKKEENEIKQEDKPKDEPIVNISEPPNNILPFEPKTEEEIKPPAPEPERPNTYVKKDGDIEPEKPEIQETEIYYKGLKIKGKIQPPYNRSSYASDREAEIENIRPYVAQPIPKIESIVVTDEVKKKNFEETLGGLKTQIDGELAKFFKNPKYGDDPKYGTTDQFLVDDIANNYQNSWQIRFYRFSRLFDTDNVKNFLTEEGQRDYHTIPGPNEYPHNIDIREVPKRPTNYHKDNIEYAFKNNTAKYKAFEKQLEANETRIADNQKKLKENNGKNPTLENDLLQEIDNLTQQNTTLKDNIEKWKEYAAKDKATLDSISSSQDPREKEYNKWLADTHFDKKVKRYTKLWAWLDYSKFKSVDKAALERLEKGEFTDPSNVYVNADGTISSHGFSPITNPLAARVERDNEEYRAFGFKSTYNLSPDDIVNGNYPGWKKEDVTRDSKFLKYNVSHADGISISKLTRKERSDKFRNEGYVVEIDASNPSGYRKTLGLIKELVKDGVEITSYRIKGMGKFNRNQEFAEIMKALPDKLPQLSLFIEGFNTDFLIHLENKEIDELNLFTTKNALKEVWSLNPWSFKKTKWINTNDYNVSSDYADNFSPTSRVVFNRLAFDAIDAPKTDKGVDVSRINNGLRMVYYVRNNEPIFQGEFGAGNDPDHKEHENSYPTQLDLSRVPTLRSLRGLIFFDEKNPDRPKRLLRKLILHNDSSVYRLPVSELNEANFQIMDTTSPPPPQTKIEFSNNTSTKRVQIIGLEKESITATGLENLKILMQLAKDNFGTEPIEVNDTNSDFAKQLKQNGYHVVEGSDFEFI